ncbi:MAG TPA: RraA family protein [Mycobacterium sp.]|nr:RraA family protein [Mycobacterium sp.]HTX96952.1 RraA family protein [Mycobacterium sp.]
MNPVQLTNYSLNEIDRFRTAFAHIGVAQIADAAAEFVKVVRLALQARTAERRVCGPVFPVTTDNDMLPCLQALAQAPAGWIVVLSNLAAESQALAGDIYMVAAQTQVLGGVVVDGAVRDIGDIEKMTIPVFSTTVTYVSARTTDQPAQHVPQPITLGGVQIEPGDWIFGDPDGFLVIDAAQVSSAIMGARVLRAREGKLKDALRHDHSLAQLIGLDAFLSGDAPLGFSP